MAHDLRELIELWERADRACEEASEIRAEKAARLEISRGILCECTADLTETRDLIARSRGLLTRAAVKRAVPAFVLIAE